MTASAVYISAGNENLDLRSRIRGAGELGQACELVDVARVGQE